MTTLEHVAVPASHTLYLYRARPGVAGGINIHTWIVRLCRIQQVIAVDVDVGRGRPFQARRTVFIYSPHLFLPGP